MMVAEHFSVLVLGSISVVLRELLNKRKGRENKLLFVARARTTPSIITLWYIQGVPKVRSSTLWVCNSVRLDSINKSFKQKLSILV